MRKTKKRAADLNKCINLIQGFYCDALENKSFDDDEIISVFLPLVKEREQIRKERIDLEAKYHDESDLLDDRLYKLSKEVLKKIDLLTV